MYDNTNTFLLGYGVIVTEKITSKTKSSSKAYKALMGAYCDDIIIDYLKNPYDPRPYLDEGLFEEKEKREKNGQVFILVIPTLEALGGTEKIIRAVFEYLIHRMHIIVLNRPEISTYTLKNEELVSINDFKTRTAIVKNLSIIKANPTKGRKAREFNTEFRKVFWKWQNYAISTEDALNLLNMSKPTFFQLSKDFMTAPNAREIYSREFKALLPEYEIKPVRGITIDTEIKNVVVACQRRMWDNWHMPNVAQIAESLNLPPLLYIPEDYCRFRLNMNGRRDMFYAAEKFGGDKELIEKIDTYFQNLDG